MLLKQDRCLRAVTSVFKACKVLYGHLQVPASIIVESKPISQGQRRGKRWQDTHLPERGGKREKGLPATKATAHQHLPA